MVMTLRKADCFGGPCLLLCSISVHLSYHRATDGLEETSEPSWSRPAWIRSLRANMI